MKKPLQSIILILLLCITVPNYAENSVPTGYRSAVSTQGVSAAIFYAVALTESGQSTMTAEFRPWPWTLSIDKQPHYFRDRESAESALKDAINRKVKQLGVGLFQIEYRYHADRFETVESMLDPYTNSRIAAEIFSEGLDRSNGDVWSAVGAFHTTTPKLADAYRTRVARNLINYIGRSNYDR